MKKSAGFTLLELMIVVAIIAILVTIAIPAYNDQMRKSRRTQAKQTLADLQLRQEKWRSNHGTYGSSASGEVPIVDDSPYYNFALTAGSNTATGYVYTANPVGDQASDSCGTLTLQMVNGVVGKLPTTTGCW